MGRVRKDLDTLCSNYFFGRGYVNEGHKKAALFLKNEFLANNLEPVNGSYVDSFPFKVNTFPKTPYVAVNGRTLLPGWEYIIGSASGSLAGNFFAIKIDSSNFSYDLFQKDLKSRALIIKNKDRKLFTSLDQILYDSLLNTAPLIVRIVENDEFTAGLAPFNTERVEIISIQNYFLDDDLRITVNIGSDLKKVFSYNVQGVKKAKKQTDKTVLVCGHYDHLGGYGYASYFPGANDNGSGISMILSLMRATKDMELNYNLLFVFFGAEEAGLIGSMNWVKDPPIPLKNIEMVVNLDIISTGDQGIVIVNGKKQKRFVNELKNLNEKLSDPLPKIKVRPNTRNSDHFPFTVNDVPAVFIYTEGEGKTYYHDVKDLPKTLSLSRFSTIHELIMDYLRTK